MIEFPRKRYIGDSVYVEFDGYNIVLTTEDGYRSTNRIVLDPTVLSELDRFKQDLVDALAQEPA